MNPTVPLGSAAQVSRLQSKSRRAPLLAVTTDRRSGRSGCRPDQRRPWIGSSIASTSLAAGERASW